jgi:phosphoribosylaminoimidazolecarboxamide formyltransferase/IMP cyclohydrolase
VIVKHANPCGVALGPSPLIAYEKAFAGDPTSAFGGIIAFNLEVDDELLGAIFAQQFVEIIIAPGFTKDARHLAKQKENCRLLQFTPSGLSRSPWEIRSVNGGILVQTPENSAILQCEVVTNRSPSSREMEDLLFSWQVVRWVKSNAIVLAKNGQTLGIGMGQPSRIVSTEIAAMKAMHADLNLANAVLASDAFFPFTDNIEKAREYGITAIIQPGGSKKDPEVIAMANEFNMAMVFTHLRCFRH